MHKILQFVSISNLKLSFKPTKITTNSRVKIQHDCLLTWNIQTSIKNVSMADPGVNIAS